MRPRSPREYGDPLASGNHSKWVLDSMQKSIPFCSHATRLSLFSLFLISRTHPPKSEGVWLTKGLQKMVPRKNQSVSGDRRRQKKEAEVDHRELEADGMFRGMAFYLVPHGVQARRLQIWKQKLLQMGGIIENSLSKSITHILALDSCQLRHEFHHEQLKGYKGSILCFEWLESSLKSGKKMSEGSYALNIDLERDGTSVKPFDTINSQVSDDETIACKRARFLDESSKIASQKCKSDKINGDSDTNTHDSNAIACGKDQSKSTGFSSYGDGGSCTVATNLSEEASLLYNPPDLNRNITEIFGKLINIYRALGDERRSFSYYKAIPVIEKLPFKIERVDQVKHLPAIGKSMQDHIHEIVTMGKLSKLEHFEKDEKVRTVALFGEIWGIGPTIALKLYEKGYRTLHELEKEDSLTNSQRLGLRYFEDIKKKIPRDEVKEMEDLLWKSGEVVLPGVVIVCGGSYRRGKAFCGDLDIIITHPDGQSHKGFLPRYVQYLKEIKFLREDLVFSIHSIEGTDSGVDTYFGLCTYPGREQRHRIDFKVYPRDIYAFGLIAWTGNDVLNRRLRLLAESKGYKLDDTGLFLATQTFGGKRSAKPPTISCKTEKEVFDILGFPWLEPHERNL